MLKKFALVLALIYSVALISISLVKLNNVPDIGVSFGDKVFHFLAYCLLTFLWFSAFLFNYNFKKKKAIISASMLAIIFGIVIEVLQETITVSRAMDIYDVIANTLGVLLSVFILVINKDIDVKKK